MDMWWLGGSLVRAAPHMQTAWRCAKSHRAYVTGPRNAWDELLADVSPQPNGAIHAAMQKPTWASESIPRDVLYANERASTPKTLQQRRRTYDTSALTPSESAQFRRIFELLEQEMDVPRMQASSSELGAFAERNAIRSRKLTARGGGVGTRFEASLEGLAAQISPEELDRGVDRLWQDIHSHGSAVDAWRWAEAHVWTSDTSAPTTASTSPNIELAQYGPQTPFFAPALHMLLIAFRDKFHVPHTALAVLERTRQLGPHAYVLGCTSSLFAEIIRTQWLCLRDAQAVLATAYEARAVGILSHADGHASSRDDAALRTQIERIRSELRARVMRAAQNRTFVEKENESNETFLRMQADDHDILQMVTELGRLVGGRTIRSAERTPKPRPRLTTSARQKKPPKKHLMIYPQNPRALLRTELQRTKTREPEQESL